jgi:hypothetical protein
MKRVGEDVAEKLDYQPGVFTVERHIRGKWACAKCEKLVQAPVAPHVIDKGVPTSGCWPKCSWASSPTTCRCTGRKQSSPRRTCDPAIERSRSGLEPAACNCSRSWTL